MRAMTEYVSNPRLQPDTIAYDEAASLELSLRAQRKLEGDELSVNSLLRDTRFRRDRNLDHTEGKVDAGFEHRAERGVWSATAGLLSDTTLTSELGVTGKTQSTLRHHAATADASTERQLTERLSWGGQLAWADNRYENGAAAGLTDYAYSSVSIHTGYAATRNVQLSAAAQANRLNLPGQANFSTDTSARIGIRYATGPVWWWSVNGGPARVRTAYESQSGWVASLQAERHGERGSFSASASQSVRPNGRGVLTRADAADLNLGWQFTERLHGAMSLSAKRNRDIVLYSGATAFDIKYAVAEASLNWRWTETATLSASAASNAQEYTPGPAVQRGGYYALYLSWAGKWGSSGR